MCLVALLTRKPKTVCLVSLLTRKPDSTFSAKWARLEAEEEAGAEDEDLTVVETEDRFEDFVGL